MVDQIILPPSDQLRQQDFPIESFIHNGRLAIVAPVWEFSPKISFKRFLAAYDRNPTGALRDYASRPPTAGKMRVYTDVQLVINRIDQERKGHPFEDNLKLAHWFRPRASARYVLRFDLSENRDYTGIAMTHWDQSKQKVFLDFALEVTPDQMGGAIRIQAMENLVYTLVDRGFFVSQVSMDKFASVQARQNIEARGIQCIEYSVDRTTEAHETLYEAIFAGILSFYNYPPLFSNLQDLIWTKGGKKIDHVVTGRKDVADATAGAVALALKLEGFSSVPEIQSVDVYHERTQQDSEQEGTDDQNLDDLERLESSGIPAKEIAELRGISFEDIDVSGDDMDTDTLDPDDDGMTY